MLRDTLVGLIEPMLGSAGVDPLALCSASEKPSDDRPPCLENPRPKGAESTLTENAPSPFHAEPRHTHCVHNAGTVEFEVLDVELLHRPTNAGAAAAKVEAENPSARVYKWTLAPGATSAMHTHERPYLIISATPLVLKMTDPKGKSFTHEVKAGDVHWVDAKVTHSLANEGTTAGQIMEIELK